MRSLITEYSALTASPLSPPTTNGLAKVGSLEGTLMFATSEILSQSDRNSVNFCIHAEASANHRDIRQTRQRKPDLGALL